jgi:hypothetical protein
MMKKIILAVLTVLVAMSTFVVGGISPLAAGGRPAQASSPASQPAETPFSCPMHPSVRSTRSDKCGVCGMLMTTTSTRGGDYALEIEPAPRAPQAGQPVRLALTVRDVDTGRPVRDFEVTHERLFHLFVVSHDLELFAHVHPQLDKHGRLRASIDLPRPGPYQLYADFIPAGGSPQLLQASVVTAGYRGTLAAARAHLSPDLTPKIDHGLRMRLHVPEASAGRELLLAFAAEDVRTGMPVGDLEPFLGAAGHLMMIDEDLADAQHSHPVAAISSAGGPDIVFQTGFPRAGLYRVWLQVQRAGEVATFAYTIPVLPPR